MNPPRRLLALAAVAFLFWAWAAPAAEVRVVASDPTGVTLRLEVGDYRLETEDEGGRPVPLVDGLSRSDVPGRPRLPFGSALLALPPHTRAVARLISAGPEETREALRVAIAARPDFARDATLGLVPVLTPADPVLDGVWPATAVQVGEVTTLRERRFVAVRIFPFRYDEAAARLTLMHELVVRVDFVGAGHAASLDALDGEPDPQFDAVFATQVLNWEQGRAWRARRTAARDGGLLRARGPGPTSAAAGPALSAFDETATEVRVRVDTTGVYAIEYDSLAAYGYPPNVPIGNVSIHRHEFVQNQSPPYVTIDLPVEVDDDGDGTFGPGDKVVVWVWDWAQRARANKVQRVWGDAEVIFVTTKTGAAQIEHRRGWLDRGDLIPLASYPFRRAYERNLSMTGTPIDTAMDQFTWTNFLSFCTPDQFLFETNDLDNTIAGSLTARWLGINSTPHYTWVSVTNGLSQTAVVVDSAAWFGIREETRVGALAPGVLTEGNTNTLKVWGKTVASDNCAANPIAAVGFNSFDVTYWRRYKPISNNLSCNSGTETSAFEISAGPFLDALVLRAYDVSDSTRPFRLDDVAITTGGPGATLRLQDTASPSLRRQYVIFDFARSPVPGAMSAVTRHRVFDHTAGDYLLIAPQAYLAAIQPLVTLHQAQGLRVVVAPLEGVQDEFNGGRKSAHAIKRFIRYAYNNWNARFVLLVGDGSEDPQKFFSTSSPDIVPVQKMFGPVPVPVGTTDYLRELIPSDFWYVWCLNCTDPSTSNLLPDLAIGRLPVSTLNQLNGVVAKIVKYDDLSGDQSWRQKMLLMADDAYSGQSFFGGPAGTSEYCRRGGELVFSRIDGVVDSLIRKSAGLAQTQVDLFELSYYLPNRPGEYTTSGGPDTCRNSLPVFVSRARAFATPDLFSRLNAGRMWWSYQGHANEYLLAHENFYLNELGTDDKSRFVNDGKPFFFSAFSCHPNSFGRLRGGNDPSFGPSVGEDLVNLPNRGAIASWASTGFEQLPGDYTQHLHVYLAKSMFVNPPRDEVLGDRGSRQVLGEVLVASLLANFTGRLTSGLERDLAITYTLLGDPATRLSIGQPQSIVTANALPVTSGQEILLHTPGPALALDATLVSSVRLDTLSLVRRDPGGTTVIWRSTDATLPGGLTVTPAFPDTAKIGSVSGGRRFHLTYADNLRPDTYRYSFRTVDRYRQVANFDAVFNFQAILRVGGQAIQDGDTVSPIADLTLLVFSPLPLTPATDLTLTLGANPVTFVSTPANGDLSGRQWLLSWSHGPYPSGDYVLQLAPQGGSIVFHNFRVAETGLAVRLENAMAFPNPFDEDYLRVLNPGSDVATVFSFELVSAAPADVTLRVYTISGRLIYARTERGLDPRWHQIPWNGLDAEGTPLANGVYFYKLLASNGTATAVHEGRLVKLRKPRQGAPASSN